MEEPIRILVRWSLKSSGHLGGSTVYGTRAIGVSKFLQKPHPLSIIKVFKCPPGLQQLRKCQILLSIYSQLCVPYSPMDCQVIVSTSVPIACSVIDLQFELLK